MSYNVSPLPRVCPGRQLAEASLFISMACIIASLDILPTDGTPENVEVNFAPGFIRSVKLVYSALNRVSLALQTAYLCAYEGAVAFGEVEGDT